MPFPAIALFLTTVRILFFLHDEWLTGIRIAASFFNKESLETDDDGDMLMD